MLTVVITILFIGLLTWLLPITYLNGELIEAERVQLGIMDLFSYPSLTFYNFIYIFVYLIGIGGLYGLLNKTGAYRLILDKVSAKVKKRQLLCLIITVLIIAIIVSFTGFTFEALIVLPFRINGYNLKENEKVNITNFINEYLIMDIFTTLEIGSPPQKVTTLIYPGEKTLILSSDICKKESLDCIDDYSLVSKKGLDLNKIKTYNNEFYNSVFKDYLDQEKNIGTFIDNIYLYNTTYLSSQPLDWSNQKGKMDTKTKIDNITMIIKDYKNGEKMCGIVGIGSPTRLTGGILKLKEMVSFFDFLKSKNIINNYNWSIKLYHKKEGRLIIGALPHEYENSDFYKEDKYITINSFWPSEVDYPWSIRFDSIYFINNKNETLYIQQGLRSLIVPDMRFIIGEENYRNLILKNYFQELIEKKICILEKTSITKFTRTHYHFGTNGIYEMFHCNKSLIHEKISFPKIFFEFKEKSLIFSLSFSDLFEEINERYFFLVIFPENFYHVKNSFWYLGLPFCKAYQFVFNFDSKTIGLYEQPKKSNDETDNNEDIENKGKKSIRYKRTLLEILFGICLVLIAYFIGKKINEQRKKRANELTDDYEYVSAKNQKINDIKNDSNKNNTGILEMSRI